MYTCKHIGVKLTQMNITMGNSWCTGAAGKIAQQPNRCLLIH